MKEETCIKRLYPAYLTSGPNVPADLPFKMFNFLSLSQAGIGTTQTNMDIQFVEDVTRKGTLLYNGCNRVEVTGQDLTCQHLIIFVILGCVDE